MKAVAIAGLAAAPAERRLLPEGRLEGPMPWVIAVMMCLTTIATAAGLALAGGTERVGLAADRTLSVQLMIADPVARAAEAGRLAARLRALPGVAQARPVSEAEVASLLEPWLGPDLAEADLPLPGLIDVALAPDAEPEQVAAAISRLSPRAVVESHAAALKPLTDLADALALLALALVGLMAAATAAVVALAARAALDTHRQTIDLMHLIGAEDAQIARLFQRRFALDALLGGLIGLAAGIAMLLAVGDRMARVGSELLGAAEVGAGGWLAIVLLPAGATALAMVTARLTVLRALERSP